MARKKRKETDKKYEAVIRTPPLDDERLVFMFEKIREVAYPRIHVVIEAPHRRKVEQILRDLNVELRSRNCPQIDIEEFARGVALD